MSDFRLWMCKFRSDITHPEQLLEAVRLPSPRIPGERDMVEFIHLWGKLGGGVEDGILTDFVVVANLFGYFLRETAIPDMKRTLYIGKWHPIYLPSRAVGPGHIVNELRNNTAQVFSSWPIRLEIRHSIAMGISGVHPVRHHDLIRWDSW